MIFSWWFIGNTSGALAWFIDGFSMRYSNVVPRLLNFCLELGMKRKSEIQIRVQSDSHAAHEKAPASKG